MLNNIGDLLSRHFEDFPLPLVTQLSHLAVLKEIPKKEQLLSYGDASDYLYFIASGLLRVYHILDNGEEKTLMFRWEETVLGNYDAIVFGQPSRFYYEALEDTNVLQLHYSEVLKLISRHPELANTERMVMMQILGELLLRNEDFVLLSPEERYKKQLTQNAAILNRVQDKHLASLLGVTPVSLSRLKKRMLTRN